jgi:hypothetical protein
MDATFPKTSPDGGRFLIPQWVDRFISLGWGRLLSADRSGAWRWFIDFAMSAPFNPRQDQDPEVADRL